MCINMMHEKMNQLESFIYIPTTEMKDSDWFIF